MINAARRYASAAFRRASHDVASRAVNGSGAIAGWSSARMPGLQPLANCASVSSDSSTLIWPCSSSHAPSSACASLRGFVSHSKKGPPPRRVGRGLRFKRLRGKNLHPLAVLHSPPVPVGGAISGRQTYLRALAGNTRVESSPSLLELHAHLGREPGPPWRQEELGVRSPNARALS